MFDDQFCAQDFDTFLNVELPRALAYSDLEDAAIYIYCYVAGPTEPTRRVFVVTEAHTGRIAVCIEAAYQLFEGDIHHYVRQIGTLDRTASVAELQATVREAHDIIVAWRPTLANIEANAFLPN